MEVFTAKYCGISQIVADIAAARQAGKPVKVAFTFTGGGARGAWEGGVAEALLSAGLVPDLIVGTSAGALVSFALFVDLALPAGNLPAPFRGRQSTMWRQLGVGNNGAAQVVDNPWLVELASGKTLGDTLGTTLTIASEVATAIATVKQSMLRAAVAIAGDVQAIEQVVAVNLAATITTLQAALQALRNPADIAADIALLIQIRDTLNADIAAVQTVAINLAKAVHTADLTVKSALVDAGALVGDVARDLAGLQLKLQPLAAQLAALEKLAMLVARAVQGRVELRESLLEFTELANTLQRYLDSALGISKTTGVRPDPLVTRWQKNATMPELLLTTTDLSATRLMLFGLAREPTVRKLIAADMWYADLAHGATQGPKSPPGRPHPAYFNIVPAPPNLDTDLVRAAITSSSIPVAFPPQRWTLQREFGPNGVPPSTQKFTHLFVDGGVVDNSPVDVAATAGATHIVSIELTPLYDPVISDAKARQPPPPSFSLVTMPGTLLNSFMVGAHNNAVGRLVADNVERADNAKLQLYRLAPIVPSSASIDTLDFDGHYNARGLTMNLYDWFMQGFLDAHDWGSIDDPNHASILNHPLVIDYNAPANHGFKHTAKFMGNLFWRASLQAAPDGPVPPLP